MQRKLSSFALETYKLNMVTFENGQPEDSLTLLNNFKTAIDRTRTTNVSSCIGYLLIILHGEYLREFNKLAIQNNVTEISTLIRFRRVYSDTSP